MACPNQSNKTKCNSKKLPSSMMKYTSVWALKTNENAKQEKFISTIKAVLKHKQLLTDVNNDSYDDIDFWNAVSTYLKTDYSICKKPILLKKSFENFYTKEDFNEYDEYRNTMKQLNEQCVSTFKFNEDNMIVLNNLDGQLEENQDEEHKVNEGSGSGLNHLSSSKEILPSDFYKTSAYSLFAEEVNNLTYVIENNKLNNEDDFVVTNAYSDSKSVPTLTDLGYTIPDWAYQRDSPNTQYSHYYRYMAMKSHLEKFHNMIYNNKKKKKK